MSANPYMVILRRIEPLTPLYLRPRAVIPRVLALMLSKALYQIEFKHYEERKLLTAGE